MKHGILDNVRNAAGIVAILSVLASSRTDAAQGYQVQFRMPTAKSAHFDDPRSADKFNQTLLRLGCESKLHSHGDHYDVSYRCAQWKAVEVESDAAAHRWQQWLKSQGFETTHRH